MPLLGKKKTKAPEIPNVVIVPPAVNALPKDPMTDPRNILDKFIFELQEILDEMEVNAIRAAAEQNKSTLMSLEQELANGKPVDGVDKDPKDPFKNWKLVHILPENCDDFFGQVNYVIKQFQSKSAADAVATGADRVLASMIGVPFELRDSLKDGKKWTAEAYIKLLQYALVIGFKDINPHLSEREKEEIIGKRIEYVSGAGKELPVAINHFCDDYEQILDTVKSTDTSQKEIEKLDKDLQALAPDQYELIKAGTFADAAKKLPPEIRGEYRKLIQPLQVTAVAVKMNTMDIQERGTRLVTLQKEINQLVDVCTAAFRDPDRFDENKHTALMEKINKRMIDDIKSYQAANNRVAKLAQQRQAMLDAIASDPESMITDANAAIFVEQVRKHDKQVEEWQITCKARKAALEKRAAEIEAENELYKKIYNETLANNPIPMANDKHENDIPITVEQHVMEEAQEEEKQLIEN